VPAFDTLPAPSDNSGRIVPVDEAQAAADVRAKAGHRRKLIDPLLPERIDVPAGCESRFTAVDARGDLIATAACEHWQGEPGSLDLAWGARRRFRLVPEIASSDVAGALGQLIGQWREHLTQVPDAHDADTAAIVYWPSRDIDGFSPMLDHGLSPLDLVAARIAGRHEEADSISAGTASLPSGPLPTGSLPSGSLPSIRQAGPADAETVAAFGVAEVRYDAHFACVIDRPGVEDSYHRYAAGLLAEPDPWIWLAEDDDGTAAGVLIAERPQAAAWIAPLTALSPVAYLMSMYVLPPLRGKGIGAMLTRRFHREVAAAGIPVTLLHYELFNPLSGPFWSRQGYRPLWTMIEARPALSLR
jgi:GNAT superfamily N-acetyltransferase